MLDTRRLTEDEAQILLREWQEEWRLLDWNIRVVVVPCSELKHNGKVSITEKKRASLIRLLAYEDRERCEMEEYDMEVALVHEIIHVALAPFNRYKHDGHKDMIQEQAVDAFSKSVVRMKREQRMLRDKLEQMRKRRSRKRIGMTTAVQAI